MAKQIVGTFISSVQTLLFKQRTSVLLAVLTGGYWKTRETSIWFFIPGSGPHLRMEAHTVPSKPCSQDTDSDLCVTCPVLANHTTFAPLLYWPCTDIFGWPFILFWGTAKSFQRKKKKSVIHTWAKSVHEKAWLNLAETSKFCKVFNSWKVVFSGNEWKKIAAIMDNPLISLGTFVWVIILFYGYLCTLGFWTLYISNSVLAYISYYSIYLKFIWEAGKDLNTVNLFTI